MLIDFFIIGKERLRRRNILLQAVGAVVIWLMIVPLAFLHICFWFYQQVYFSIFAIPKIPMQEYFILDRIKLKKLNWFQRLNCFYCEYANCILAWSKAVANRTEIYSCAIKHDVFKKGQEHQEDFAEFNQYR
jgi:hypothetical protein